MACVGDVVDGAFVVKIFKSEGAKSVVHQNAVSVNVDGGLTLGATVGIRHLGP